MSFLAEWWAEQRQGSAMALAELGVKPYADIIEVPTTVPAYPWLPDGTPLRLGDGPMPVSFVDSVRHKFPALMNLDQLRRGVHAALAGKPDVRTPEQRRHDDWVAYEEAKKRWL